MVEQDGTNLVFIFSTPRAGSTLLSAILSGHERIHCPNEPWFLLSLASMYEQNLAVTAGFDYRLTRMAFRDLVPRDDFLSAARSFALEIYNRRLAAAQKEILVDKTPRYCHILPFINDLFPKAKKIWLTRNPLDVAASFRNTWKARIDELTGMRTTRYTFDLVLATANLCDFFETHPGFQLRYEDLARQPQSVISNLCQYLNIASQDDLASYARNPASLDAMKNKMMGDKTVFLHDAPHSKSIDAWKTTFSRREIQRLANAIGESLLNRAGYESVVAELRQRKITFPPATESDQAVANYRTLFASHRWTFWDEEPPKPKEARSRWWRKP
jgi:hypothetical protein